MSSRVSLNVRALFIYVVIALSGLLVALRAHADDFLEPEQAFKLSAKVIDERSVELSFVIAPGYYLYREQFKFDAGEAKLAPITWPSGKKKFDETFQKEVETFRNGLKLKLQFESGTAPIQLKVVGQGCAEKGLCYPPMTTQFDVGLKAFGGAGEAKVVSLDPAISGFGIAGTEAATVQTPQGDAAQSRLDAALQSGRLWPVLGVFFVAGLLLSLTPCVLPMLPILSSIIVGEGGKASRLRSFSLAVSYSLGMALVYTALGVAAGLAGEGLAASLQKPWVLTLFALALVGFSLSMFGVYELTMPHRLTGGLSSASQRLPAGHLTGVFVMGGVSALIVSPCVAAPLAGALVYLSQTHDVVLGGSALFALACGMSVPLLLLGLSAGTLLPRAGPWMDGVKHFFGILLLGVALWTVQPILPAALAQAAWGALLIGLAAMLGMFEPAHAASRPRVWLRKTFAMAAMVFGLAQLLGAAAGGTDTLRPLASFALARAGTTATESSAVTVQALPFKLVRSVEELDGLLKSSGKPVMLDFYADWCVSCKEMERYTFADPQVRARLAGALLLKADVTANNADDKALLKRFKLFGPPGTIFFTPAGDELPGVRVIGFQDAPQFNKSLDAAGI